MFELLLKGIPDLGRAGSMFSSPTPCPEPHPKPHPELCPKPYPKPYPLIPPCRVRSSNGLLNHVAGLCPVTGVEGVENVGISRLVSGHAAYLENMPSILDALGLDL